jgi:hypothetical protein
MLNPILSISCRLSSVSVVQCILPVLQIRVVSKVETEWPFSTTLELYTWVYERDCVPATVIEEVSPWSAWVMRG